MEEATHWFRFESLSVRLGGSGLGVYGLGLKV